jgi:chemotaxis protein CheC
MGPTSDGDRQRLRAVFEGGAEHASLALSKWIGRPVRLDVGEVDLVEPEEATGALGPGDALVAACVMDVSGRLSGQILLVFDDRDGLALADLLLHQPAGTATAWGELEQSAAQETANIVGCAYLNAMADHLPPAPDAEAELIPSPPAFRHEFAASLLEFALMDQAMSADRVLLIRTTFAAEGQPMSWSLLFVPSGRSLADLLSSPSPR